MKNHMQSIALSLLFVSIAIHDTKAQCVPSVQETCADALVICSLDQLNGYSCSNTSTTPSACSPLCSQGGAPNNTSWLAFVSNGGTATITLNVGNCNSAQGVEFGMWADCVCGQEIVCRTNPCIPPNGTYTANPVLVKCKTYYLWVDGCNGDICDFTLNTSGGVTPALSPLGKINNVASSIIEPICEGACSYKFFVNPQPGGCEPTYVWTLDGNEVGGNSPQLFLDMPNSGDFIICVTAYLGNPQSGSICTQEGPQCATAKVRKIQDKIGPPRTLCNEQTSGLGYKWHSQRIKSSGVYHQKFSDGNCCSFDSIKEFIVLESPEPAPAYYITCDNKPYVDILGNKHVPCQVRKQIPLNKTTDPFKCDSSIILTAIHVDLAPNWDIFCAGGMVELIPNIRLLKTCNAGETYQFEYRWYAKNDPSRLISTDERLLVQATAEEYCLEVTVRTELESEVAVCTKIFCESFDEGGSAPECNFLLSGDRIYCFDSTASYRIDNLPSQKVNFYNWTIDGGTIVSNPDSSNIEVRWTLGSRDTGKVCASYMTDCGNSCQKCIPVVFETKIAGEDFERRGLSAYLDAKPHPNGQWRLISGPHPVRIEDPSFARTKITAFNYGYYCFEWSVVSPYCTMRDTLCVNLHYFKKASPEYPELLFFDRNSSDVVQDGQTEIIFTPNLIDSRGESVVSIHAMSNDEMNYGWFDICGRILSQGNQSIESGLQKIQILSPVKPGMYFLLIELNGLKTVRKVCVME